MPNAKTILTISAALVGATAAGCAIGLMVAPASGEELRRSLGRRARRQWSAVSHSCERTMERVADRAKREFEETKKEIGDMIGA